LSWLPESLPDEVAPVWTAKLPNTGHGGVAVAEGVCVVGMRDLADEEDLFDAFDAETGERLWRHSYAAPGSLDYGNASRATPLIREGVVYLFGALGQLTALDVTTGDVLWEKDLAQEYDTPELPWGLAGTPLLVGDLLVVQPGGRKACLVGLDPTTGDERWKTAGGKPSHSSFIHWQAKGAGFVIGFDAKDLAAYDVASGRQVWKLSPEFSGDFNVPTPVRVSDQLLFVATENNGAQLIELHADCESPKTSPDGHDEEFAPDSHTPVAMGNRIYGVHHGLWAFDAAVGPKLSRAWHHKDPRLDEYGFLAACGRRLVVLTDKCELLLFEDQGTSVRELDSLDLRTETTETLSAPAFVGTRCYVRIGKELKCLELGTAK
jgi:outer membrane protein assembly factor BamB